MFPKLPQTYRPAFFLLTAIFSLTLSAHAAQPLAAVPFVGCPSDGQMGPQSAPLSSPQTIHLPAAAAGKLAYYAGSESAGVLAPRGWHCLLASGSDGDFLVVTPVAYTFDQLMNTRSHGIAGPAIQLSLSIGGTSGRFEVARIAARVFPRYSAFVKRIIAENFEPASDFHFGPFPADKLTYRSDHLVEFVTPSNASGLGTRSWLAKGPGNISGFAWIGSEDTDVLMLTMRLPPTLAPLGHFIVKQAEAEISH